MKKQNLILQISNPCSENWEEMNIGERGRFCTHCQNTVTDISGLSDAAIVKLFQERTDVHCVRALTIQLDRTIALPAQAPTRFYRIAVALGLTIMMAGAANSYARPPLASTHTIFANEPDSATKTGGDSTHFSGRILESNEKPLSGAVVNLRKDSSILLTTLADSMGNYQFDYCFPADSIDQFLLEASLINYSKQEVHITAEILSKKSFTFFMQPFLTIQPYQIVTMGAIAQPITFPIGDIKPVWSVTKVYKKKTVKKKIVKKK